MLTAFRKIGKCPTPRQRFFDFVIYCVALLEVVSVKKDFVSQTKMATGWTQFQPWQNQPLPPGWEARYDANVRR